MDLPPASPQPRLDRRALLIGVLAGGWLMTLVSAWLPGRGPAGLLRSASAEDPQGMGPNGPNNPQFPAPKDPLEAQTDPRGVVNPGNGTADSNNRAIALAASLGGGQSAVWYFDTQKERVLVYQLEPGSRGGLRLVAARHIDFDLRLSAYNDISDKSRMELKEDYESSFAAAKPAGPAKPAGMPTKNVALPGGK